MIPERTQRMSWCEANNTRKEEAPSEQNENYKRLLSFVHSCYVPTGILVDQNLYLYFFLGGTWYQVPWYSGVPGTRVAIYVPSLCSFHLLCITPKTRGRPEMQYSCMNKLQKIG